MRYCDRHGEYEEEVCYSCLQEDGTFFLVWLYEYLTVTKVERTGRALRDFEEGATELFKQAIKERDDRAQQKERGAVIAYLRGEGSEKSTSDLAGLIEQGEHRRVAALTKLRSLPAFPGSVLAASEYILIRDFHLFCKDTRNAVIEREGFRENDLSFLPDRVKRRVGSPVSFREPTRTTYGLATPPDLAQGERLLAPAALIENDEGGAVVVLTCAYCRRHSIELVEV